MYHIYLHVLITLVYQNTVNKQMDDHLVMKYHYK